MNRKSNLTHWKKFPWNQYLLTTPDNWARSRSRYKLWYLIYSQTFQLRSTFKQTKINLNSRWLFTIFQNFGSICTNVVISPCSAIMTNQVCRKSFILPILYSNKMIKQTELSEPPASLEILRLSNKGWGTEYSICFLCSTGVQKSKLNHWKPKGLYLKPNQTKFQI